MNRITFNASVSTQAYTTKPTSKDIASLEFIPMALGVEGLAKNINDGKPFSFLYRYEGDALTTKDKTKKNFIESNFIVFDLDHQKLDRETTVRGLNIKPTIEYNTPSNGINGEYAYRFIYACNRPMTSTEEFEGKTRGLAFQLGILDRIDKKTIDSSRYFNGSFNSNPKTSNTVVNVDEITPIYSTFTAKEKPTFITTSTDENDEFLRDLKKMKAVDFLKKYEDSYSNWMRETKLEYNENGIAYKDENYIELEMYWGRDEEGKAYVKKVQIGHRNTCLYMQGCTIRKINKNITLEGLIYAMYYLVTFYYDNSDGELTPTLVMKKAKDIMGLDWNEISVECKKNKGFKVSTQYAEQTGISKQKLAADERTRQHDQEISVVFDPFKTDKENMKVLKEQGVKVTDNYLKAYRERNNCKLQDVQLSKIEELIAEGMKDKDIMKVLNIAKRTFYRLKTKLEKSAKNGDQDIKLKNNNTYISLAKIGTNSNHEETNLNIDSSFESLEGVELMKSLNITVTPEPTYTPSKLTTEMETEIDAVLDMIYGVK